MNNSSGVGVLDKTVSVLSALESGPASLAQLVKAWNTIRDGGSTSPRERAG